MAELSRAAQDYLARVTGHLDLARGGTKGIAPLSVATDQPERETVFRRAAVLHVFTTADLVPAKAGSPSPLRVMLEACSFVAPGQHATGRRSLRRSTRLKYLADIGSPEAALDLLAELPAHVMTPTQAIFEDLLKGTLPALDSLTEGQLILLEEVQLWGDALGIARIDPDKLDTARISARTVGSFQHLVAENFVGRDDDVRAVKEILGIADPDLLTRLGSFFRGSPPRLAYLEGVGGIGKTALIGHVLTRFRADADGPIFAFAYMACDDPGFDVLNPRVMLGEAARQISNHVTLAAKYRRADPGSEFHRAMRDFKKDMRDFEQAMRNSEGLLEVLGKRHSIFASQEERLSSSREATCLIGRAFAWVCWRASQVLARGRSDQPAVVVIIDSFEEVQGRAESVQNPFWDCLETILHGCHALRVVEQPYPSGPD